LLSCPPLLWSIDQSGLQRANCWCPSARSNINILTRKPCLLTAKRRRGTFFCLFDSSPHPPKVRPRNVQEGFGQPPLHRYFRDWYMRPSLPNLAGSHRFVCAPMIARHRPVRPFLFCMTGLERRTPNMQDLFWCRHVHNIPTMFLLSTIVLLELFV